MSSKKTSSSTSTTSGRINEDETATNRSGSPKIDASSKTATKKKFGLISSLHNSTIKSGAQQQTSSSSGKNSPTLILGNEVKKQSKTETELLENFNKGISVTSSDVKRLTTYTKS